VSTELRVSRDREKVDLLLLRLLLLHALGANVMRHERADRSEAYREYMVADAAPRQALLGNSALSYLDDRG
jgi:hypothetical protein